MSKRIAVIYTDGSCDNKDKYGGWAAMLEVTPGDFRRLSSGYDRDTTNQRMELQAAVGGLRDLPMAQSVLLISDSAYLVNGIRQNWIANWSSKDGQLVGREGNLIANGDLWLALDWELARHDVLAKHVPGKAKDPGTLAAHKTANEERRYAISYWTNS